MKIAMFRNIEHNFNCVGESALEGSADYIRTSEYVDVELPMLPGDPIAEQIEKKKQAQIESLRKQLAELEEQQ